MRSRGATEEVEDWHVDVPGATMLELVITPDVSEEPCRPHWRNCARADGTPDAGRTDPPGRAGSPAAASGTAAAAFAARARSPHVIPEALA